jgi:hypothetical protein
MSRNIILALAGAVLLGGSSLAMAGLAPVADAPYGSRSAVSSVNYLDVRQYRVEEARVPGTSTRQSVTAWQVNAGTWNGQSLDGLSIVLIEQNGSEGSESRTLCCYVSDYATPAQREALLAAMRSSQPLVRDAGNIRLEPAVIRLEQNGDAAVIHLALIA